MGCEYTCPICKKRVQMPDAGNCEQSRYFPFCSKRCKMVDLGAWLDSEYKITTSNTHETGDEDIQ